MSDVDAVPVVPMVHPEDRPVAVSSPTKRPNTRSHTTVNPQVNSHESVSNHHADSPADSPTGTQSSSGYRILSDRRVIAIIIVIILIIAVVAFIFYKNSSAPTQPKPAPNTPPNIPHTKGGSQTALAGTPSITKTPSKKELQEQLTAQKEAQRLAREAREAAKTKNEITTDAPAPSHELARTASNTANSKMQDEDCVGSCERPSVQHSMGEDLFGFAHIEVTHNFSPSNNYDDSGNLIHGSDRVSEINLDEYDDCDDASFDEIEYERHTDGVNGVGDTEDAEDVEGVEDVEDVEDVEGVDNTDDTTDVDDNDDADDAHRKLGKCMQITSTGNRCRTNATNGEYCRRHSKR